MSVAAVDFIHIGDKLDALTDDEEDDDDDKDPRHTGLLDSQSLNIGSFTGSSLLTRLSASALLGWALEDFRVVKTFANGIPNKSISGVCLENILKYYESRVQQCYGDIRAQLHQYEFCPEHVEDEIGLILITTRVLR